MKLLKKILFPTDFGESMDAALESAINVAKKFDSELILLHVLPEKITTDHLKELVTKKMEEMVSQITEQGIECYSELIIGNQVEVICDTAERKGVNLVLLGASKARKLEYKLGSSSDEIIRNVSMPVWVIEKDKSLNVKNILCPVDFSDESKVALDNALHVCRRFDAELKILHVVKSHGEEYSKFNLELTFQEAETREKTNAKFDEFLKGVNLTDVNWEKEVIFGDASTEIIKSIKDNKIDILVMGSTGNTGLKRLLIGSVTQKVSRKVPCSFIISKSEKLIHLELNKSLDDIDSLYQEGIQLAKDGFTEEAIVAWKKCTALNQLYLKAWSAIASAYDSLGRKEDAKKYNDTKNRIQQSIWDQQVEADLRSNHKLFK
jgi:nucleotide-binding universal stress UspA family protein